jgi:carbon-monoxide dehydrogenase medium subunit
MIALVALDTQVEIASQLGLRMEPILNLFRGPGKTALQLDRELIVKFLIPLQKASQASAFGRVMRPQGVALPILNLAVWLERSGERINRTRIAVGPAGPVPVRACMVEEFLQGAEFSPQTVAQAKEIMQGSLPFRTSAMRATAAYRRQLSEVLLEEVIGMAWNRARCEELV